MGADPVADDERRRTGARTLLLAATDPDVRGFERYGETDWSALPWEWLLDRARFHKLHGLFVSRMDQCGFTTKCPSAVQTMLDSTRNVARLRVECAGRTLYQVLPLLHERGIPFFVIKGHVLAEHVYGGLDMRPFNDVDLVIPESHMSAAEELLTELGFFFWCPPFMQRFALEQRGLDPDADVEIPRRELRQLLHDHHRHQNFVLREHDPRIPIELHWQLSSPGVIRGDPDGPWRETIDIELSGLPCRTLSREATLVYVAVHAMQQSQHRFKLLHLVDVVWIADRWGDSLDPGRLHRLARDWGVERHLIGALETARAIFPFPLLGARSYPRRSRWTRGCLQLAGMDKGLVDHGRPRGRWSWLAVRLVRETFWDLAFLRAPRRVRNTLAALSSIASRRSRPRRITESE